VNHGGAARRKPILSKRQETWHHPYSESWWVQHHALGMFFSSRYWVTSQGEKNNVQIDPWWKVLWSNDLSTQPRQRRIVSECPWVAQPEPGLEPASTSLSDLKIAVRQRSPSNLTELDRICREEWEKLPKYRCAKLKAKKKTQGCNRCQRCFNKVLSKGSEYLCKCDMSKNLFSLCHYGVLCVDWFNQF
jgi:hypothetical protein